MSREDAALWVAGGVTASAAAGLGGVLGWAGLLPSLALGLGLVVWIRLRERRVIAEMEALWERELEDALAGRELGEDARLVVTKVAGHLNELAQWVDEVGDRARRAESQERPPGRSWPSASRTWRARRVKRCVAQRPTPGWGRNLQLTRSSSCWQRWQIWRLA